MALFLALALLRLQLVSDMGLSYSDALESGILRGWFFDATIICALSYVVSLLWTFFAVPLRLSWSLAAFFVWVGSLANVLHFSFFRIPLDWWIIEMHWHDVGLVQGSAAELSIAWPIIVSLGVIVLALALNILRPRVTGWLDVVQDPPAPFWTQRTYGVLRVLFFLALTGFLWRGPVWFGRHHQSTAAAITDNIVRQWWQQNWSKSLYQGVGTKWTDGLDKNLSPEELKSPSKVLAAYRDWTDPKTAEPKTDQLIATATPTVGSDVPRVKAPARQALAQGEKWPLYTTLSPDAEETRALRNKLGLPESGPVNVIFLFSESMRALELYHPETGPDVFPRLTPLLAKHAVTFRQAYSSSFSAGQTVRGQYSTQCSMLPNMLGAAEYIAHTTVKVTCVQGYLKDNGYRTTWFNSFRDEFHGKRAFEKLHGMDEFYDGEFFAKKGITQRIGDWGLADRPMLKETLAKLVDLAKEGKPLYSNILTISTHHPYSVIPEGPLTPRLAEKAPPGQIAGYLSRFRYADDALSDFIEGLFQSPIGDNTLIVFLGDHGSPVGSFLPLTDTQKVEMRYRIPLAFLTKNMREPGVMNHPVHQVDVVPTVARVLGLPGNVSWMGKNMFSGEGSPWFYIAGNSLHYRAGSRACYDLGGTKGVQCFDVTSQDPLLDELTVKTADDANESQFFRKVAQANMRSLVLNLVQP